MTARSAGDNGRRCFIQINTREGDPVSPTFCVFFAYNIITRPRCVPSAGVQEGLAAHGSCSHQGDPW